MSTNEKSSSEIETPRKYTKEELVAAQWKLIRRMRYERVSC